MTAGAGYLGRSAGKWFFEVEVLETAERAMVTIGVAGINFRADLVGEDDLSWAIDEDGKTYHRLAPNGSARASPSILL